MSSSFTAVPPYRNGLVSVDVVVMLCAVYSHFISETSRKEYSYTQNNMRKIGDLNKKVKSLNCPCGMRSSLIDCSTDMFKSSRSLAPS